MNEEGRRRRGDDVVEDENSSGRLANRGYYIDDELANRGSFIDNRYYSKSKELGQIVDIQPRDLPSLFARSARGAAAEEERNSTNSWLKTRN